MIFLYLRKVNRLECPITDPFCFVLCIRYMGRVFFFTDADIYKIRGKIQLVKAPIVTSLLIFASR